MYEVLRSIAIEMDIPSIQAPAGEPMRGVAVAIMEIGLAKGVATFVAIADGTVSMYTSVGGGVVGAGEHAAVRDAGQRFRVVMADTLGQLEPTTEFPLPDSGQVRFHARAAEGGRTGVATEAGLRTRRHPLSALYASGQDLVTEIRLSTPGRAAE